MQERSPSSALARRQLRLGSESYPHTSAIRVARADLRAGKIDNAEYERRMKAEIADVIALQEQLRLDVPVHGEPERNDMGRRSCSATWPVRRRWPSSGSSTRSR
jgi:hypothetical protein